MMGHGQVNAYNFLKAIASEGAGQPMTFPNVFVKTGAMKAYIPDLYISGSNYTLNVENESIASVEYREGKIYVKGLKAGQTKASISTGAETQEFIITVRESGGGNGWL